MTASRLANLVQETVPAPGTGTVQLAGVVTSGFVAFNTQFVNGDTVFYGISDGVKTEIGEGAYSNSAGVATLVRSTVLWSSLGGTAHVNFTASCRCWSAIPAERATFLDDTGKLPFSTMPRPLQDRQVLTVPYSPASGSQAVNMTSAALSQLGFSSTIGQFTVGATGWYSLGFSLKITTTTLAGAQYPISIQRYLNGTGTPVVLVSSSGGIALPVAPAQANLVWDGLLNATDVIKGQVQSGAVAGTTVGGDTTSYLSITRLSP